MELLHGIPDKEVYTLLEVATGLNRSTRTIRNWIKDGSLQAFKLGNAWHLRYEEIERFLRRPMQLRDLS